MALLGWWCIRYHRRSAVDHARGERAWARTFFSFANGYDLVSNGRCDLCGLPLPRNPTHLDLDNISKQFCCEGCARVFEVAQDTGMLDVVLAQTRIVPKKVQNQHW